MTKGAQDTNMMFSFTHSSNRALFSPFVIARIDTLLDQNTTYFDVYVGYGQVAVLAHLAALVVPEGLSQCIPWK